jgi:MFS family permease
MSKSGVLQLLRKHPPFRRFALGLLASRVGDRFYTVAIAWLVLSLAGPAQLGAVLLLSGLPRMFVSPLAGVLLDRFGARRLLVVDNVGRALIAGTVSVLALNDSLSVWHLYVLGPALGILSTLTEVGENVVVPELVSDADMEPANAMLSANWQVASLAGPALAGALIGVAGPAPALAVDALTFVGMAWAAYRLGPTTHPEPEVRTTKWTDLFTGFRLLASLRVVLAMTVISVLVNIIGGAESVAYPVYARDDLHTGAFGYGLLITMSGVGSLLGLLLLTPRIVNRARSSVLAVILASQIPIIVLAVNDHLWLAGLVLLVLGFAGGPYYALDRGIVQRAVPAEYRGRVFGARSAINSIGYPAGAGLGGVLLAASGAPVVMVIIGVAYLPLVALALLAGKYLASPASPVEAPGVLASAS